MRKSLSLNTHRSLLLSAVPGLLAFYMNDGQAGGVTTDRVDPLVRCVSASGSRPAMHSWAVATSRESRARVS
jgi:hypothetical protein